jgi:metal-responsive CopG/Arc/MetJ family transcriptional regulator
MSNGDHKITTGFNISENLLNKLDEHVNNTGVSRSELVEYLLRKVLDLQQENIRNSVNTYFNNILK